MINAELLLLSLPFVCFICQKSCRASTTFTAHSTKHLQCAEHNTYMHNQQLNQLENSLHWTNESVIEEAGFKDKLRKMYAQVKQWMVRAVKEPHKCAGSTTCWSGVARQILQMDKVLRCKLPITYPVHSLVHVWQTCWQPSPLRRQAMHGFSLLAVHYWWLMMMQKVVYHVEMPSVHLEVDDQICYHCVMSCQTMFSVTWKFKYWIMRCSSE